MKSIIYCIALSFAVTASALPSSGSLSNLDRKYGTNKGTPRKASNTTTRKKSSTVRRDTKPEARPAAQPAVRLSTEEMLQRTSSLLQAWVNKDGQTLRALAGDKIQLLLLWNSSEVVQTGKDDFASQMLRTPEEIRAGYKISGIKIINAQEQGILAQMDFGVGGAIPEGFIIVMFDSSGCISQLAMVPGKTTDGVINASNRAAFIDLPNVGFSSEAPYGAAANNGDGAAADQPRTGRFTWGGVNEEYDQDPKYKEALATTLDELPNLEYKLYHYLRHDPKTAVANAKLFPFADEIYLLGLGKTVSPEEFCEIANSGKAKWPADAEPTYEPDDIRGGVFTFTADIPMMGSHEPACILVTLLLNREGKICGIGETELTESGGTEEQKAPAPQVSTDNQTAGEPQDTSFEPADTYFKVLVEKARFGDANAQCQLGTLYTKGIGTMPKDYSKAAEWYRKAAEQGNASAQLNLGYLYEQGTGVKQDFSQAMSWYRMAGEQGLALAMNNMGNLYEHGLGVRQDYAQAIKWYRMAAEQGNASAQANLGALYDNGRGVKQDFDQALKWFRKAAENGNARGQANLAVMYLQGHGVRQDMNRALELLRRAAEQNDDQAQLHLSLMYYDGTGVKQDYAKAAEWCRKAAEKGNPVAQLNLGVMYYEGQGVGQDYAEAAEWYRKAAEKGNTSAQFNLGLLYHKGQGVEQDYARAAEWYLKAAPNGEAGAQLNLGLLYYDGRGVEQDYAKAAKWYLKAAEQGEPTAQNDLGVMYYEGQGVEQDYAKAQAWYSRAAAQGNATAQANLGELYEKGAGVERNLDKAVEWYRKAAEHGSAVAQRALEKLGK